MNYLKQFLIILTVCLIGEILHAVIPLPIPASIYGLVLMLICLIAKIIPEEKVSAVSDFLIGIMPVMFIPAAVGLLDAWVDLKPVLVPVTAIMVLTTVIVMVVTGRLTQFFMGLQHRREGK